MGVAGTPALQPVLQRHGSRGEEGLWGGEGEEGEEVDLRANWEAARETEGFGEQEEQAVHWEAEGPTEEQHKGLRFETPLRNFVFTQRLEKTCPILNYNWTAVLIIIGFNMLS